MNCKVCNKPTKQSFRKFCSQDCYHIHQKLNPNKGTFKYRKIDQWGEKNHRYIDGSGWYYNLHNRISDKFGRPKKCENCGTTEDRKYEWSNISGKYLFKRSDWRRLCVPCHRRADITPETRKKLSALAKNQPRANGRFASTS